MVEREKFTKKAGNFKKAGSLISLGLITAMISSSCVDFIKPPIKTPTAPSAPTLLQTPEVSTPPTPIPTPGETENPQDFSKPNIVVIMLDDMPAVDHRVFERLPNINSIFLKHSTEFTNYFGETPLCCPGRVGFLTGQHTFNHGVDQNDARLFNPSMTIATQLHKEGYRTVEIGKNLNRENLIPNNQLVSPGWDVFDTIYEQNGHYYNFRFRDKNGNITYYGRNPSDYSTDVIAKTAVSEIEKTPLNKPLFAFFTPFAVHSPTIPTPSDIGNQRCQNIPPWNTPNYNEADISDKPQYVKDLQVKLNPKGQDLTATCETLLSVDRFIGRIRTVLEDRGQFDNTVFVLTNDNGMNTGAHGLEGKETPYADQMPLFIHWPQVLGNEASIIPETVLNIDVAPTICEIAGCTMGPYPNGQQNSDGMSFLPVLLDHSQSMGRDAILEDLPSGSLRIPTWYSIRTTDLNNLGLWRYTEYLTREKELYNISNGPCYIWNKGQSGDPCELNNLANNPKYQQTESTLATELNLLKNETH